MSKKCYGEPTNPPHQGLHESQSGVLPRESLQCPALYMPVLVYILMYSNMVAMLYRRLEGQFFALAETLCTEPLVQKTACEHAADVRVCERVRRHTYNIYNIHRDMRILLELRAENLT